MRIAPNAKVNSPCSTMTPDAFNFSTFWASRSCRAETRAFRWPGLANFRRARSGRPASKSRSNPAGSKKFHRRATGETYRARAKPAAPKWRQAKGRFERAGLHMHTSSCADCAASCGASVVNGPQTGACKVSGK